MNKPAQSDTRQHLLAVGRRLMAQKGFASVGLAELLAQAGVPKGSFYHYFASKEQFGEALIAEYAAEYADRLDDLLCHSAADGYSRLMNYWQAWQQAQQSEDMMHRCLVVKLSGEVADLSEPMRLALLHGCTHVIERLCQCIQAGQQDGSVNPHLDARQTAAVLYALWIGASLVTKLGQNDTVLSHAMQHTQQLLAPPRTS